MDGQNRRVFGHMPDGREVEEVTLRDGRMTCSLITYGGALRSLTVPDRDGNPVDVLLGYDTLDEYRTQRGCLGALVGRVANRIAGASFTLNGREYQLAANKAPNHCHGGVEGFHKKVWTVEDLSENAVTLSLFSPDGEEGYPGNLRVWVQYSLQEGALEIDYLARTDADTLCNLTSHAYFNLSGQGSGSVEGQYIQLMAGCYTPTGPGSIPTGEIAPVEGTPMDLRNIGPIGAHIDDPFGELTMAGGYDQNWCVDDWDGSIFPAARAWSPDTGILMETWTTLPGVQFYTANSLSDRAGKGGARYGKRGGFCLETQLFPDAPHHPNFPSALLSPGEDSYTKTIYRFGTASRP